MQAQKIINLKRGIISKQRLQELEAQYNACIHQQEAAKNTNQSIINEIGLDLPQESM